MRLHRILPRLVAPVLLYLAVGCAHIEYVTPPRYEFSGVSISQIKIEHDDDDLDISLLVTNQTDRFMVIDRNQILCALPSGQMLARSNAMVFGIPTAPTYTLPPRASHEVQLSYKVSEKTPQVALMLNRGIFIDNRSVELPAYVITQKVDK